MFILSAHVVQIDKQKLFQFTEKEVPYELIDPKGIEVYVMNEMSCFNCLKTDPTLITPENQLYILLQVDGIDNFKRRDLIIKLKRLNVDKTRVVLYLKDDAEKNLPDATKGQLTFDGSNFQLTWP